MKVFDIEQKNIFKSTCSVTKTAVIAHLSIGVMKNGLWQSFASNAFYLPLFKIPN